MNKNIRQPNLARRLLSFLSTMELAITLLLTLAIASVIGTVLQQNQPYPDYLLKFGPFWFDVFESLGLYDVYSALWFLSILVLLVISTSVCVFRNAPTMLRDIWHLRTQIQTKSLRAMVHHQQWTQENGDVASLTAQAQAYFKAQGFRHKVVDRPEAGETLISAMRGGMNRMGYLLTHLAIIVICLGGLMDSNVPMKLAQWQGNLKVETRDLSISQVPQESRLPIGSHAFRGSISIPEGKSASVAFLGLQDGYVMQELPFQLAVKDFRTEHYATGQPKSFETDLVLTASELDTPLEQTISVNHPLTYDGYTIYQSSFADGGSPLELKPWLLGKDMGALDTLKVKVFGKYATGWGEQASQLEVTNFRLFNINPDPTDDEPENMRNFGPSINFKIRSESGEAREYENYMLPVPRDGRDYFFSGVRGSPNESFKYLYLPVDENESVAGVVGFIAALQDESLVETVATQMARETLSDVDTEKVQLNENLQQSLSALVALFLRGGFAEVGNFIETSLPEADRDSLGNAYLAMLREMLGRVYIHTLENPEIQSIADLSDTQVFFLQDSVTAVGALSLYGTPVYLELTDYTHVQASGLQIAHMPGKPIVYFGCAMLIIGVFLLFYLPQRRFWLILKPENNETTLLFSGMSNRNPYEFDSFFEQTYAQLKQAVEGNFNAEKRSE